MIIRRFLATTSSQLTYAGLFQLSEQVSEDMKAGSLCALFRNSHFSVLYKRPDILLSLQVESSPQTAQLPAAILFQLVTDQALLHESTTVWESLEDIDGAASRFYHSNLQASRMREDWVSGEDRSADQRRERDNMNAAE